MCEAIQQIVQFDRSRREIRHINLHSTQTHWHLNEHAIQMIQVKFMFRQQFYTFHSTSLEHAISSGSQILQI